jgi:ribonuclease HII
MPGPSCAVWKGDQVIGCVAAASVVAKVTRDRMMRELDTRFPQYGFASHKGYCTPEHDAALLQHGPCEEHRYSFVNVRQAEKGISRRSRWPGVPAVGSELGQDGEMAESTTAALEGVA